MIVQRARQLAASIIGVALLCAGCSVDRGNYLQSTNGDVVVALPAGWDHIDAEAILSLSVERLPAQDHLVLSHWVAGFSAQSNADPGTLFSGTSAYVGGIVRSRHIVSPELDIEPLSVNALLSQMNDLALLPNGAELVTQRNQRARTFAGTVNGIETEFDFATATGTITARYVVAVDVLRGQLHSLFIGCSATCFDTYRADIDRIVDSFTIVAQAPPRAR